jgi:hypothetical protein
MHPQRGPRPDAPAAARIVAEGRARSAPENTRGNAAEERRAGVPGHVGESSPPKPTVRSLSKSTRQLRRAPKCRTVGVLGDEPTEVAKRVQQLACTADVVVWVHEEKIFAAAADSAVKVLAEQTIGIYGTGVLLAEIEDDIERFRRRRSET